MLRATPISYEFAKVAGHGGSIFKAVESVKRAVYKAASVPSSTHMPFLPRARVMGSSSGIPRQMGESSLLMYWQTPHTSLQTSANSKSGGLGLVPKLELAFLLQVRSVVEMHEFIYSCRYGELG